MLCLLGDDFEGSACTQRVRFRTPQEAQKTREETIASQPYLQAAANCSMAGRVEWHFGL